MADAPVAKISREEEEKEKAVVARSEKASAAVAPAAASAPAEGSPLKKVESAQTKESSKDGAQDASSAAAAVPAAAAAVAGDALQAKPSERNEDEEVGDAHADGKAPRRRGSNREAKENRMARDGRKRERSPDERRKEDRRDLVRSRITKEEDGAQKPKGAAILDFGSARGSEDKVSSWKDKGGASKQELLGQGRKKGQLPPAPVSDAVAKQSASPSASSSAAASGAAAKEPSRKKSAGLSEGASQPQPIPTYFEHDDRSIGAAGGRRRRASSDKGGPHVWMHDKFQIDDKRDTLAKAGARPVVSASAPPAQPSVAVVEKKTTRAT